MTIDVFEVIQGVMDKVFSTLPEDQKKEQFKKEYLAKLEKLKKEKDPNLERMRLYEEVSKMVEGWGVPMEKLHAIVALGSSANAYEVILKLILEEEDERKLKLLEEELKIKRAATYDKEMKALAKRREDLIKQIGIARQDSLDKNVDSIKHDGQVESLMNEKAHHEELVAWIKDQIASYTKEKDVEIAALRLKAADASISPIERDRINQEVAFKEAERDKQLEEMQSDLQKSSDRFLEIQATLTTLEPKSHELNDAAKQADEKLNSHYREEAEILEQQMNLAKSFGNVEGIRECEIRKFEIQQETAMAELTKNGAQLDVTRDEISNISRRISDVIKKIDEQRASGKNEYLINCESKKLEILEKQLAAQQAKEKELLDKEKALTTSVEESQEKISKLISSSASDNPKDKEVKNTTEMVQKYIGEFSKEEFSDGFKEPDPSASVDQRIASLRASLSREIQLSMDADLKQLKTEEDKELYYKSLNKAVKDASKNLPEKKDKDKKSKLPTLKVDGANISPNPTLEVPGEKSEAKDDKQQKMSSEADQNSDNIRVSEEDKFSEDDPFKRFLAGLFRMFTILLKKSGFSMGGVAMGSAKILTAGIGAASATLGAPVLAGISGASYGIGKLASKLSNGKYGGDPSSKFYAPLRALKKYPDAMKATGSYALSGLEDYKTTWEKAKTAFGGIKISKEEYNRLRGIATPSSDSKKKEEASVSKKDTQSSTGPSTPNSDKGTQDLATTAPVGSEKATATSVVAAKKTDVKAKTQAEQLDELRDDFDSMRKSFSGGNIPFYPRTQQELEHYMQSLKETEKKTGRPSAELKQLEARIAKGEYKDLPVAASPSAFDRYRASYPSLKKLADMTARGEKMHPSYKDAHPGAFTEPPGSKRPGSTDMPLYTSDLDKDKKKKPDPVSSDISTTDDNDHRPKGPGKK